MARPNRKQERPKNRLSHMISNRINLLFAIIVFLFVLLLLRLAQMQLVDRAFYQEKLEAKSTYTVRTPSPRGKIYDAKGRLLVTNEIKEVVAFTRSNVMSASEMKALAWTLSSMVSFTETQLTEREKKDYYLADSKAYQEIVESLPEEQRFDKFGNRLAEATVYANAVAAVPADKIAFSEEELKVAYVFSQMNATPTFGTSSLKTAPLTAEQIARISANTDLEGISIRADWERQDMMTSLSSIIGRVSTEKSGLPEDDVEDYLAKGYSLNDRVGTSYLEKAYEDKLQGKPHIKEVTIDKKGAVVSDVETQAGSQGKNIKLTVDLDFQKGVEDILKRYFQAELEAGSAQLSEGAYAVALNPNTGAVLALAGVSHDTDTGQVTTDALGTVTKSFTPGSVVKGATIASGYENGILSGNQVLDDQAIQLAGSNPIKSWFTYGAMPITATQALEYSSNTYMVQIAIQMMGQIYYPGMVLSTDQLEAAMTKLRQTYGQFGMGVATGLDMPGESIGYVPENYDVSGLLTESFGQFDNYTTMQLAQYAATVANGGKRLSPRLVEGIYSSTDDGQLGGLEEAVKAQELNTVNISADEMGIIQQGFYDVVNSSSGYATGKAIGEGAAVSIAAKTGTAESYVTNKAGESIYTTNMNVVAYAPSYNPQIAVAVVLPHETDFNTKASHYMTRDIINLYQQLHPMN